jgi:hypothetical protein
LLNQNKRSTNGSYFFNGYVELRENDPNPDILFIRGNDFFAKLNGYAVIPLEEYYKLKGDRIDVETKKKIKDFDKMVGR